MTLMSWASDFGSSAILLHGTVLRVSFHFKNKMNFALAVNKCEKVSSSEAKASLAGPEPASGSAYTPKAWSLSFPNAFHLLRRRILELWRPVQCCSRKKVNWPFNCCMAAPWASRTCSQSSASRKTSSFYIEKVEKGLGENLNMSQNVATLESYF